MDLLIYYQVSSYLLQEESYETNLIDGSTYNKYLCSSVIYIDSNKEINFLNGQLHGLTTISDMRIMFNRNRMISYESNSFIYNENQLTMTINGNKVNLILKDNIVVNDHELRRINLLEPIDRCCEVKVSFNDFKVEVELIRHRYI